MDIEQRTRKNHSIEEMQDVTTYHPEKHVMEHYVEERKDDETENRSIDDESGDGQGTKSEDDMDSGVTFDEDSEKDIDTIEIEEEDWIEHIKEAQLTLQTRWNMQRFDAGTEQK